MNADWDKSERRFNAESRGKKALTQKNGQDRKRGPTKKSISDTYSDQRGSKTISTTEKVLILFGLSPRLRASAVKRSRPNPRSSAQIRGAFAFVFALLCASVPLW
jgi:hypothetical protein